MIRARCCFLLCLLAIPCVGLSDIATPFQFSFATPLQLFNRDTDVMGLRLDVLYGMNKNLYGLDLGIGGNWVDEDMLGFQIAGLGNFAERPRGIQIAGLLNMAGSDMKGLQVGGVYNYAVDFRGIQLSGLMLPLGVAGVIAVYEGTGDDDAGILDSASAELLALLALMSVNYVHTGYGLQTGFINGVSEEGSGAQLGGINVASGDSWGQVGVVNFTDAPYVLEVGVLNVDFVKDVSYSAQVGVINYTDAGAGFQIGVMNWATGMYGLQIGLVNFHESAQIPLLPIANWCF